MTDFEVTTKELFENLGQGKIMTLATGDEGRISARSMSVCVFDNKFYFQTDRRFLKFTQIQNNPNVALCCENISVEGRAMRIGKPLEHSRFCEIFKKLFNGSFNAYSSHENEVLFEVEPTLIKTWIYENSYPYVENFDFEKLTYTKIPQDIKI